MMKHDRQIRRILMGLATKVHAELYKYETENISSNIHLSDSSRVLRNTFHFLCCSTLANLNEGMVLSI